MSLTRALLVHAVTLASFLAIDFVWLGLISRDFYRRRLGHLLADQVNWSAAVLFYLLFGAGLAFFAVWPALQAGRAARAVASGAIFGLVAYATYDLTNQATLRDWPAVVTAVDLEWGTFVSAAAAWIAYTLLDRVAGRSPRT